MKKVGAFLLMLVVAYFLTQGDLTALNELPTIKELPSLSDISLPSKKETSPTKKVKQTEKLEIPAPMEGNKDVVLRRTNYTLSFNKATNLALIHAKSHGNVQLT